MVGSNEAAVRTNVSYTVRHFRYLWRQDVFQDRQLDYWLLDSFVQVVKRTARQNKRWEERPSAEMEVVRECTEHGRLRRNSFDSAR